eukprot:gene9782-biopygen4301
MTLYITEAGTGTFRIDRDVSHLADNISTRLRIPLQYLIPFVSDTTGAPPTSAVVPLRQQWCRYVSSGAATSAVVPIEWGIEWGLLIELV